MSLPDITPEQINALFPNITCIGEPMKGGQKVVYKALIDGHENALMIVLLNREDEDAGDALKLLETHSLDISIQERYERAVREIGILKKCESRYIVGSGLLDMTVCQSGQDQLLVFSEEWVNGTSLADLIKDEIIEEADSIKMCIHIMSAVQYMYSATKSIHRDIKPGNIIFDKDADRFVLLDMGLAYDTTADSLTQTGFLVGTPAYLSPEQISGNKSDLDYRSDMFSTGVVAYEMLTGSHPFRRPHISMNELCMKILHADPKEPKQIRPVINEEINDIVMRMLSKKPHNRYRKIGLLLEKLELI